MLTKLLLIALVGAFAVAPLALTGCGSTCGNEPVTAYQPAACPTAEPAPAPAPACGTTEKPGPCGTHPAGGCSTCGG